MIVGVDPAPRKASLVCIGGNTFRGIESRAITAFVAQLVAEHSRLVVAWDAPLSFDARNGFADRPVDRVTRAWMKAHTTTGRLAPGAVSVLPFSGCPHWAISCAALGLPFGTAPGGLRLSATPGEGEQIIVEVHPAVSLARWWIALGIEGPMPRYKRGKNTGSREVRSALEVLRARLGGLGIPAEAFASDDHLDAWVAWRMGDMFVRGEATWLGSPAEGGYVVPVVGEGPALG
jgi:hypothetical protein